MNTVPHHIFSLAQKTYSKHLGTNPENTYLLTMENAYEETLHLKSHSSQGAKPVGCCTIPSNTFTASAAKTEQ